MYILIFHINILSVVKTFIEVLVDTSMVYRVDKAQYPLLHDYEVLIIVFETLDKHFGM
jgi:hypothetical protein